MEVMEWAVLIFASWTKIRVHGDLRDRGTLAWELMPWLSLPLRGTPFIDDGNGSSCLARWMHIATTYGLRYAAILRARESVLAEATQHRRLDAGHRVAVIGEGGMSVRKVAWLIHRLGIRVGETPGLIMSLIT